nr:hypothetical protein K-LCC10_0335 [Kaumoebavirus]
MESRKRKIVDRDFVPSKRLRVATRSSPRYDGDELCKLIILNQKQEQLLELQRKYIKFLESRS